MFLMLITSCDLGMDLMYIKSTWPFLTVDLLQTDLIH